MGITYLKQIDRVHQLLSQNPEATINRVTDDMIIDYLQEAQDVVCLIGRVWECVTYPSDGVTGQAFTYTTMIGSGWTPTTSSEIIDIIDVSNSAGVSYNKIPYKDRGKLYQSSATDTMWWTTLADTLFLYPSPADEEIKVYYHGRDKTTVADTTTYPALPDEYHFQLINYATFRGKQAYNQNQEALMYLSAVAQGLGLDLTELKSKVGA